MQPLTYWRKVHENPKVFVRAPAGKQEASEIPTLGTKNNLLIINDMDKFYDILILTFIAATALPAVILLYHQRRTPESWEQKNKKLSSIISYLLLLGTITVLYGSLIEPKLLITNYQTLDLEDIKNPIKIGLISDLHVGDFNKEIDIQKIANRLLELNPDLVFIAGDHILTNYKEDDRLNYLKPLKEVAKKIPTYAVNGNHEYGVGSDDDDIQKRFRLPNRNREVAKAMRDLGIKYLINDVEKITVKDESFLLFGSDEYLINAVDFENLKQDKGDINMPVIMLSHNPAVIYLANEYNLKNENDIDLVLSGHTHGGQVRLPFIGVLQKIESDIPLSWYQGFNEFNGINLFVTSGANESGTRARLFNPPEIVLLTIN